MIGLDSIVENIEMLALARSNEILEEAETKRREILQEARNHAKKECKKLNQEAEIEYADLNLQMKEKATLVKRKVLLEEKQKIICSLLNKVEKHMYELSKDEYEKILTNLIKRFALDKKGEIVFSLSDTDKIPNNFEQKVIELFQNRPNAGVVISKEKAPAGGGFFLRYDDVEINCMFKSILEMKKDELQDKIHGYLFESGKRA